MIASVCWTPFQILNAINYKLTYKTKDEMDIYICMKFRDSEKIAKALSEIGLFHQVFLVKNLNYDSLTPIRKKFKILKDLFLPKHAIIQCLDKHYKLTDKEYDIIISAGYLNFNIYFSRWFQKKKGAQICFIEDGIESYLKSNTADNYSGIYKVLSTLTKNGGTSLKISDLYVYCPDLVSASMKYGNILLLPSLNTLPYSIKIALNHVFGYENEVINTKVIYFDQIGTGDFPNEELMFSIQNQILKRLENNLGEKNIQIKLHPRTKDTVYPKSLNTFKTAVPWELITMNEFMGNKILISLSSTACLTPKLIFDEEPVVIFLFKLFPLDRNDNIAEFIHKMKKLYKEPNRVCIPENMEELEGILDQLKAKGNKNEKK